MDYPGRARIELIRSENVTQIIDFTKKCLQPKSMIRSDRGHAINALSQPIKNINGNVVKRYNYKLNNAKFGKEANPLELVHNFISSLKAVFH